jgi:hypothetical protein
MQVVPTATAQRATRMPGLLPDLEVMILENLKQSDLAVG